MKVVAAAVQITPSLESAQGTVDNMERALVQAANQGVQLAVFPETFVPYYPYFSFVDAPVAIGKSHLALYNESVVVPGPITARFSEMAARFKMVLVIGVNERAGGTIYNAQLVYDADGQLLLHRRKITPSYHERMIWGQGDGSGLRVVDSAVGRVGALACWEHYNPLARYTLMTGGEQIHCSQFPGSMVGQIFADQIEVTIRHHALESGCFVVNSTGWLTDEQRELIAPDPKMRQALTGGCFTAIISPEGKIISEVITEGEGLAIAELDFELITKRKRMLDSVGHYARPDLFSVNVDRRARGYLNAIDQATPPPFDTATNPEPHTSDGNESAHTLSDLQQKAATVI
ncbi:MAG: Nit6803 family nitrilase [Verrucomicrobiota bacterium]